MATRLEAYRTPDGAGARVVRAIGGVMTRIDAVGTVDEVAKRVMRAALEPRMITIKSAREVDTMARAGVHRVRHARS